MQVVEHELQQLLCPVGLRVEAHQVGAHGVALQAEELERKNIFIQLLLHRNVCIQCMSVGQYLLTKK